MNKQYTMKQLFARRQSLKRRADKLQQDKKQLMEDCHHPVDSVVAEYKSYAEEDIYRVDVICHVCLKRWSFNAETECGSYNNPYVVCKEVE